MSLETKFERAKQSIEEGRVEQLLELLTEFPDLVKERAEVEVEDQLFEPTLLHYAVGFPPGRAPVRAMESVEALLEKGASTEALDKGAKGSTALQHAAGYNMVDLTEILLENGADPNNCENHEYGMSATVLALFEGYTEIVSLLVKNGAEVNIDVAAGIGDIDLLKTYFDDNGKVIDSDTGGDTKVDVLSPFLYACQNGQIESVKFFLDRGADINLFPPGSDWGGIGASGLHWAVEKGHLDLVKFMVANKADLQAEDDVWNRTPLQLAQAGEAKEIIEFLETASSK